MVGLMSIDARFQRRSGQLKAKINVGAKLKKTFGIKEGKANRLRKIEI